MKCPFILTAITLIGSVASVRALPAAFVLLETQTQSGTYGGAPGQTKLGSQGSLGITSSTGGATTTATGSVSVTGTIDAPVTMLSATVNYSAGNGYYAYTEATAELVYEALVSGPTDTTATVDINFSIKEPGGEGPAYATYGGYLDEIFPGGSATLDPNSGDPTITGSYTELYSTGNNYGQLTTGPSTPILTGTSVFSEKYTVPVGTTFLLALSADAASDRSTDWPSGFPPAGSYSTVIDPTLAVDPSTPNASAYSLDYSTGIQPPSVPNLIIVPKGESSVELLWAAAGTYTLLQTTNLVSGVWTTNTSSLTTANGTNSITITSLIDSQYFRLKQ
ncbi:MAG TPA: hypothetical protein VN048_16940 [Verrucomicrobiae bacterium]|jgi:hypothetical protein|nr:hypothetical protein [Verrucomicrobiae bacterium]